MLLRPGSNQSVTCCARPLCGIDILLFQTAVLSQGCIYLYNLTVSIPRNSLQRTMPPTIHQATGVMLSVTGLIMVVLIWTHPEEFSVSAEHFAEALRHRRALRSEATAQRKLLLSPTTGVATIAAAHNSGVEVKTDDSSYDNLSVSLETLMLSELDPEDRERFYPNALFEQKAVSDPELDEDEYEQRMSLFLQSLDAEIGDEVQNLYAEADEDDQELEVEHALYSSTTSNAELILDDPNNQ